MTTANNAVTDPAIDLDDLIAPAPQPGQSDEDCSARSVAAEVECAGWSAFGSVLPVLAGSSGAGASVFAAVAVDVLQQFGQRALLVDTGEPPRSGLCSAAEVDGDRTIHTAPGVIVRYSWRGHAVLARREHDAACPDRAGLSAIPCLEPHRWLPLPAIDPLHATVVDLGSDWTRPEPDPGRDLSTGMLAWLRAAYPAAAGPRPVLVVRATRPSLAAAEAALARFDPLFASGELVAPARLVVMASWKKRGWPRGVVGTAGARVARLLDDAVFVPYDRDLDLGGVTAELTPPRVRAVVAQLLGEWGLLPPRARPRP
jgi:hypothetical protein